jgi:hypothetical protein
MPRNSVKTRTFGTFRAAQNGAASVGTALASRRNRITSGTAESNVRTASGTAPDRQKLRGNGPGAAVGRCSQPRSVQNGAASVGTASEPRSNRIASGTAE